MVIWDILCFFIIFVLLSDYSLWGFFCFCFFKGDMMTPVEESVLHRLHLYRPGAITRGKCVFPDSWAMAKGC